MAGYPWWPGQVVDPSDSDGGGAIPCGAPAVPPSGEGGGGTLVLFFGDATWQWFDESTLLDFEEHCESKMEESRTGGERVGIGI